MGKTFAFYRGEVERAFAQHNPTAHSEALDAFCELAADSIRYRTALVRVAADLEAYTPHVRADFVKLGRLHLGPPDEHQAARIVYDSLAGTRDRVMAALGNQPQATPPTAEDHNG